MKLVLYSMQVLESLDEPTLLAKPASAMELSQ